MATIIPAILASTKEEVAQKLLHARDFATEVQLDVVDGSFASPSTWPYSGQQFTHGGVVSPLPHADDLCIELDLMIDDPEKTLHTWMAIGARKILFHLESTTQMKQILDTLHTEYGYEKGFMEHALQVGIAINQETRLELLEPYLEHIDYVQFMGIKRIGVQSQPFSKEVLSSIRVFRQKHPNTRIQVDGGVSVQTAPALLALGVSRLVVGSAIWNTEHPERAYTQLQSLAEQYGLYE